jgi:hypothetical protein
MPKSDFTHIKMLNLLEGFNRCPTDFCIVVIHQFKKKPMIPWVRVLAENPQQRAKSFGNLFKQHVSNNEFQIGSFGSPAPETQLKLFQLVLDDQRFDASIGLLVTLIV